MGRTKLMNTETPQINFASIENIKSFVIVYDEEADTLYARPEQPCPATSIDWDGQMWIRVDPENGEIVGLEIDDFEAFFIKKYPEVAQAWSEAKPLYHRKASRYKDDSWQSFVQIILGFILQFFKNNPQQASLGFVGV